MNPRRSAGLKGWAVTRTNRCLQYPLPIDPTQFSSQNNPSTHQEVLSHTGDDPGVYEVPEVVCDTWLGPLDDVWLI